MHKERSIFDIVGPTMIGPSSSHTAGAARLGGLARAILGETPASAIITLHGSFAKTGEGHGTKRALIGGLMGLSPDDERIVDAPDAAKQAGLEYQFLTDDLGEVHPNTVMFDMKDADGSHVVVRGSSVGGAAVVVDRIDSYEVNITGDYHTVLVVHLDRPGLIACVTGIIADSGVNIASMQVAREQIRSTALMTLEVDEPLDRVTVQRICKQPDVQDVRLVPKI